MAKRIVAAIMDRAEGNESIGTMWQEVGLFDEDTPISAVLDWAKEVTAAFDDKLRGTLSLRFAHDNRKADANG